MDNTSPGPAADLLLTELAQEVHERETPGRKPATYVNVAAPWSAANRNGKLNYSHKAMIDAVIEYPGISHEQIGGLFGYSAGWVAHVLASDAFQAALAARREEIIDPALRATVEERTKALVIQSLAVLQRKLEQPQVSDTVALRAYELGAKAMGLGGNAQQAPVPVDLDKLAERLIALNPNRPRVIEGEVIKEV